MRIRNIYTPLSKSEDEVRFCIHFHTSLWVIVLTVLVVGVLLLPVRPATASDALSVLVGETYRNNQELQSMEGNAEALLADAPFAGSLQDPDLGVGLLNVPVDSFDLDQEAMTKKLLLVAQKFPWFGTLDLRQQVVDLKALEASFLVQSRRLEAAEKRLKSADKSLLGLTKTLPHKIDRILAEIEGARENYHLYSNALSVQAAHLADSSMAAYSVDNVEFNTMLSARVRLLRIELRGEKYKYRIYQKQVELEGLIGVPLSGDDLDMSNLGMDDTDLDMSDLDMDDLKMEN